MNYDKVRSWLKLPPGNWPPDHYALLGLHPGETDLERIEHHVHERFLWLRSQQLNSPDQVTEAMNLLARAFTCLTDPEAKKSYDAQLFAARTSGVASRLVGTTPPNSFAKTIGSWVAGWTLGANGQVGRPIELIVGSGIAIPETAPETGEISEGEGHQQPLTPAIPLKPPADAILETARSSSARRGLVTKRALYYRIGRTRQLLAAWERAGKYLNHPARRLARSTEAAELTRQLGAIRRHLENFPPLLGEAGQPGFYVVTLANQPKPMIVPTFRMLLPTQRETLARDCRDGFKLLTAHRQFLRQELRSLRKITRWGRLMRTLDAFFTEHPGWFLLAVAMVAMILAIWLSRKTH